MAPWNLRFSRGTLFLTVALFSAAALAISAAPGYDRPPQYVSRGGEKLAHGLDGLGVEWSARDDLGKVSVIGAGMKSHPGVAAKAFETLAGVGIEPAVVTTSPIKIACHLRSDEVDKAVAALHRAFELDAPGAERQHA